MSEIINENVKQCLKEMRAFALKVDFFDMDRRRAEYEALQCSIENEFAALEAENAELRENADIVKYCGFEIITEEELGKYPARKVLRGADGWTYVPGFPEVTK